MKCNTFKSFYNSQQPNNSIKSRNITSNDKEFTNLETPRKLDVIKKAKRYNHRQTLRIGNLKLSTVLFQHKKQNDFSRHISIFNLLDSNSSFLRKVGETDRASAYS